MVTEEVYKILADALWPISQVVFFAELIPSLVQRTENRSSNHSLLGSRICGNLERYVSTTAFLMGKISSFRDPLHCDIPCLGAPSQFPSCIGS
jgi:hypothetical protein